MRHVTKERLEAAGLNTDLDIFDAPDEVLREICSIDCYDAKRFRIRLRLNNRWSQLLNSQIVLDHISQEFLTQEFRNNGVLKVERWGLQQKVELLFALGVVSDWTMRSVLRVNKFRNKAAHQHGFDIDDNHVRELLEVLPVGVFEGTEYKPTWRNMLIVVTALFEGERQNAELHSLKRKGAFANVRRLLDDVSETLDD